MVFENKLVGFSKKVNNTTPESFTYTKGNVKVTAFKYKDNRGEWFTFMIDGKKGTMYPSSIEQTIEWLNKHY